MPTAEQPFYLLLRSVELRRTSPIDELLACEIIDLRDELSKPANHAGPVPGPETESR